MNQVQPSVINKEELLLLQQDAISLLKKLVATPSFSKEENETALIIEQFLRSKNIETKRHLNNVWAKNKFFHPDKPTLLLNSHHDTVKPNSGYTTDPFLPDEKEGKLFGLGSNDAGGCLVSLIAVFIHYYNREDLKYNIVLAATAEEEISGHNGIESLLQNEEFLHSAADNNSSFSNWCAIVGEPTQMQMAVAEKGLLVVDCIARGKAGHAAREEGENAIYNALNDIRWISTNQFPNISDFLGPVKMSVTSLQTENKAHNVVPASCNFVVDIRVNELYTFDEILQALRSNIKSEIIPRSTRLRSSSISTGHPLVKAGLNLGRTCYGSPTTSDKALMNFPALKMGPGFSARSHSADEYIFVDEIREGIEIYVDLLRQLIV